MHQGLCVGWRHDDHMYSKFQEEARGDPWEKSRGLRESAGEEMADPRRFRAMAIQFFATPVLCFDSELTLHKETTLTRLDRKVHAILSLQDDEMEVSSADIHTAGKRAPDPSEPSCEIVVNRKL